MSMIGGGTTYQVNASCTNCGWSGSIAIPKGRTVSFQPCILCGCNTLVKHGIQL